jgi:ribonuclease E
MSKELYVTSTPHETKLAIVEDDQLVEVYFERENEYTLAGSIYKGRVTRVLPGMQSAFVDIGLERDAFLYVTDFLEEVDQDDDTDTVAPAKPVESQNGGRDRDRGRRHRGGDRNRQPRPTQESPALAAPSTEESVEIEADYTHGGEIDAADQTTAAIENQLTDQATAETAMPERTGGRRWRGRRGRRRGRGGKRLETQEQAANAAETTESAEHGVPVGDSEGEDTFEISESFVDDGEDEAAAPLPAIQEEQREVPKAQPVHAEPRRERPRQEPIVLPGESLRKHGGGAAPGPKAQAPASSSTRPMPRPSTEVTDPVAFLAASQGVLAGESLAKYRNRPQPQPGAEREPAAVQAFAAPPEVIEAEQTAEKLGRETVETAFAPDLIEAEPAAPVAQRAVAPEEQTAESLTEESREEDVPRHARGTYNFAPGSGVVEEEEIASEEEQELGSYVGPSEDGEFEELEEETLESEEEASKEAQMIAASQGLAAAFAESRRTATEPEEFMEEELDDEEDEEEGEGDDIEGVDEEAEVLAEAAGAEEEQLDPEHPDYEGRAEVRSAPGTAGLQQRTERTDRDRGFRRGGRGRRPGGRRPPMRGRRNIPRGPMPQINELLKEGQEILVQIAKEPMAKKGARITSHIALPGRFLVFMPTVNHTGVSRKIGSDDERRRLKQVLLSEKGDQNGGFIVRTAAAGASEEDLRADIRFLLNLWGEIKQRSESGKAPALIYHDLNLVERILRDQVTGTFSQIWVDTEAEYERILRFAQRFQPSLIKRVKLYSKETPLFEQFNIHEEINKALKSKVWLKSGGYIVINQTEALVAIDINTGKYVGKTGRLEDTIVKTNIDAIQEIVRQIRLRDLGGIIIIDFIDMDERKNRQKVMQALEEALKKDRSPSKVLQFNDFGLVAITRKRVKQSLERTLSTSCVYCTGTGMIKSVTTVCNEIYVELRKMVKHLEGHQIMLRVNPEVAKALKENSGKWLTEMEELIGKTIIVKSDPAQHQEQFEIH